MWNILSVWLGPIVDLLLLLSYFWGFGSLQDRQTHDQLLQIHRLCLCSLLFNPPVMQWTLHGTNHGTRTQIGSGWGIMAKPSSLCSDSTNTICAGYLVAVLRNMLCSSKCWCFYSAACGGSFAYARCNGPVTWKERHPIKSQFSNCELFWLRPAE